MAIDQATIKAIRDMIRIQLDGKNVPRASTIMQWADRGDPWRCANGHIEYWRNQRQGRHQLPKKSANRKLGNWQRPFEGISILPRVPYLLKAYKGKLWQTSTDVLLYVDSANRGQMVHVAQLADTGKWLAIDCKTRKHIAEADKPSTLMEALCA